MSLTKQQSPVLEKNRRVVIQTADAALTLAADLEDNSILIWTGVITAGRVLTLPTGREGMVIRVTRTAAATGAFDVDVGGLADVAVSEWCEVTHNGTAFVLTAFGAGIV